MEPFLDPGDSRGGRSAGGSSGASPSSSAASASALSSSAAALALWIDLGGKRAMRVRFDASVPRARAFRRKSIHASRPFREMIARPHISRNEWNTAGIGAVEVGHVAPFSRAGIDARRFVLASGASAMRISEWREISSSSFWSHSPRSSSVAHAST